MEGVSAFPSSHFPYAGLCLTSDPLMLTVLDEFKNITSAREIPMFKDDQWEITLPALMQEEAEDSVEGDNFIDPSCSRSDDAADKQSPSSLELGGSTSLATMRSTRLKGMPLMKSESDDLVAKVHKQMRRVSAHFLVATFARVENLEDLDALAEEEGEVDNKVVNSRQVGSAFS